MKNRIVQYKLLLLFGTLLWGIFSLVAGQYYYFDNGWTTYQQGCDETLIIRLTTESHAYGARAWLFRLVLDPTHFAYSTALTASILRTDLFDDSVSNTFANYTSNWSPSWKDGIPSILQIDRKNNLIDYQGDGIYGKIIFSPLYSWSSSTGFFSMIFVDGDTTQTSLSQIWGINIINAAHQNNYLTWYYYIYQQPCVNDTTPPSNAIGTPAWTTKQSHLSGIALTLNENGGNPLDVPYVRTGGLPGVGIWTGNAWAITNQYGVNFSTFHIRISGNGTGRYFTGGMFSPAWTLSAIANGTTWQFRNKNYTVDIDPSELFNYGIEKEIIITWNVRDRNNNLGTFTKTFNTPVKPWLISPTSPAGWATWIPTTAPILLWVADDWAGVNSWSIRVTLEWIWWTTYGPYIFSGNDLNMVGVPGNANEPDYQITISGHLAFPSSWTIQVSIDVQDLAGNQDQIPSYSFTTRPSCGDLGCCNNIYVQTWTNIPFLYNPFTLTISGGISPSFIIHGNTGTVDCGMANEYAMDIYKWTEEHSWVAIHVSYFDLPNLILSWASNVKAVLSGNTLTLQKIYVPPITGWCIGTCGWGWGWGGWVITIDNCTLPSSTLACANTSGLDNSNSFYDHTCCGVIEQTWHAAAGCDVSDSTYSQEITDAFVRWYNLNITNKCPISTARLEDNIVRKELAKMMTMFTVQIVGIYPDTHKVWCDQFSDTQNLSDEMKFYAKTACQLDLMGLESNGKTPDKVFNPNNFVPRSEFGTVLSRLIYGDQYNIYSWEEMTYQWYEKHLRALNEDNIMKKIQNPFILEERARVLLMLERTTSANLIERYRLVTPVHNWALYLLENVW